MANVKELRGRIKSVGNIRQITKAMEMVASMKLRKVQAKAVANRPYTEEIVALIGRLADAAASGGGPREPQPLIEKREKKTVGLLVFTSDRGLCGAFNSNLVKAVRDHYAGLQTDSPQVKIKFYTYGRKGYSFATRRKLDVEKHFAEPPLDKADFVAAKFVTDTLVADFLAKKVDAVGIVYTQFQSQSRFVPTVAPLLPIDITPQAKESAARDSAAAQKGYRDDYLLEPDPQTILRRLLPRYLETLVYFAIVQSLASEHASRRMAMKGATDAANRIGKELKMEYNRARQENITKELLDIIGGASAVS